MSLNFIPTGTVNYYPYTFNKITSERKILFEGAVPLHEIVYTLYDLFLYYINNTSINIDTYFTAIVKDNNKCVVHISLIGPIKQKPANQIIGEN